MFPESVPAYVPNRIAPAEDWPVPAMVKGSGNVTAAPMLSVAPDDTVVPWPAVDPPNDDASVIEILPLEMVVVPV